MTLRAPAPSAQLAAFLSRFPPETVAFGRRCLSRLRRAFPGSYQLVYRYAHAVVVAFSASERGYEGIVAISIAPREVRLYFDKTIPDPHGLLKGTGGKVRSVNVETPSDLDKGDLHALIKAAKKHSGATFRSGRPVKMIIRSNGKKRPAKPRGRA